MNAFAIVVIAMGLMVIVTRGPLIVAPGAVRDFYMGLIGTDGRMRWFGVAVAALGAVFVWAASGEPGVLADVFYILGLLVIVLALIAVIPFPAFSHKLAAKVWGAFNEPALRVIGVLAVLFGIALVYFGFSL